MDYNLAGKVALITGSTRGIGRATAILLAKEGMKIAINYLKNDQSAEHTRGILRDLHADHIVIQADVSKPDTAQKMIDTVQNNFGHIDVLVNNAGIVQDASLHKMSLESWDNVIKTNLYGAFHCIKYCLPIMIDRNGGSIINVSSVMGISGNFGQINYASSKSGLIGLTKSLSKETARWGIRVNAIAPGFVETDMTKTIPESIRSEYLKRIPLGRFARPDEIANLICFLASDKSSYITGQIINIDGGFY